MKINMFVFIVLCTIPLYSCTNSVPHNSTEKKGDVSKQVKSNKQVKPKNKSKTVNVHALQRKLKDLGYYNGPIDGKVSPETKAALRNYAKKPTASRPNKEIDSGVLWGKLSGGCKRSIPLNLLKMPSIFKYPISRSDIKSFKKVDSCDYGSTVIYINPQYNKKIGMPKSDSYSYTRKNINSLNYPLLIEIRGSYNKNGYIEEGNDFTMYVYEKVDGFAQSSLKDKYGFIFTKSFLEKNKKHLSGNYSGLKEIYTDGKGNFYDGKKSYVKNGLETSGKEKNYFDFTVKLQSGSTQKYSFDDSKLISKVENSKKDLYVYYSVTPKNKSILTGKKYKVKIVIDMKAEYAFRSDVKVFGISPVSYKKTPLYKEIDLVLSPSNGWKKDGKILLSRVEKSYSGKGLGVRVMKNFNGIKDKKVYIKSIKEM